jgi:hypothetical protein
MFFEEQVSDHSGLLLATMQMAAHGGDHTGTNRGGPRSRRGFAR